MCEISQTWRREITVPGGRLRRTNTKHPRAVSPKKKGIKRVFDSFPFAGFVSMPSRSKRVIVVHPWPFCYKIRCLTNWNNDIVYIPSNFLAIWWIHSTLLTYEHLHYENPTWVFCTLKIVLIKVPDQAGSRTRSLPPWHCMTFEEQKIKLCPSQFSSP